jgi:hypothetical protein
MKIVKLAYGTTRTVLLTKRFAFKFPSAVEWRLFLLGLLGNMQEARFSGLSPNLCPVLFSIWGGFLVVMPRCRPLSISDFGELDVTKFTHLSDMTLPVENKMDSFGWLNGKIVAVDYGS